MSRSDKGRKRPHYDSSKRKERARLRLLKEQLESQERERKEGRSRRERRRDERLAALPKDRICPMCGTLKLRSRQWTVISGIAICLSCFRSNT